MHNTHTLRALGLGEEKVDKFAQGHGGLRDDNPSIYRCGDKGSPLVVRSLSHTLPSDTQSIGPKAGSWAGGVMATSVETAPNSTTVDGPMLR